MLNVSQLPRCSSNGDPAYPSLQVLENLDLDESLMVEALLVPDDLDSDHIASLMISAPEHLAERAFAERIDYLEAEHDVIALNDQIVAALVVVTEVVGRVFASCHLLLAPFADVVDGLMFKELFALVVRQMVSIYLQGVWEHTIIS